MNKMEYISIFSFILVLHLIIRVDARVHGVRGIDQSKLGFDDNYVVTWGNVLKLNQGNEIQLSMDNSSGSGFESKNKYQSGFFQMRIKLPPKDSAGVVTAFYMTSKENHTQDEVDFEFLGNREGKPITMQTNVITNGRGDREQKFVPWFDPTKDFHTYEILWNPYHIVFYVDKIPIRVFKNITSEGIMSYPLKPMQVVVSLWNGEGWATDGGKAKINWAFAPFKANFQGCNVSGCLANDKSNACGSSTYRWNTESYSKLSDSEQKAYRNMRRKYMSYDYCSDRARFSVPPSECKWNQ